MLRDRSALFFTEKAPRRFGITVTVIVGACALVPLVVNKYLLVRRPEWARHLPLSTVAVWLFIVAAALVWGCSRARRMGLRIDHEGVEVRNYFRTYRIGWPELTCLADGSGWGEGIWAMRVQHGSGTVTAIGTATSESRPEMLAEIRQAAEQHGIPAELTGTPSTLPGPKWRPYLPAIIILALLLLLVAAFFTVSGSTSCQPSCWPTAG